MAKPSGKRTLKKGRKRISKKSSGSAPKRKIGNTKSKPKPEHKPKRKSNSKPKSKSKLSLKTLNKKLDIILDQLEKIKLLEKETIKSEMEEINELGKEESGIETLEKLEKEVKREVVPKAITKITYRDFVKSIVGAFFGIMGHFAFFYGIELADKLSMLRATLLYFLSFVIGILFVYFTGFRKVSIKRKIMFVPVRVFVIYGVSLIVIVFVLSLFGFITPETHFTEAYKTISSISVLAVLGAVTADLIGREE